VATCEFRHIGDDVFEFRMAAKRMVLDEPFSHDGCGGSGVAEEGASDMDWAVNEITGVAGNETRRVLQRIVKNHKRCSQTQHISGVGDVEPFQYSPGVDHPSLRKASGLADVFVRRTLNNSYKNMTKEECDETPLAAAGDGGNRCFFSVTLSNGCSIYIGPGASHTIGLMLDSVDRIQADINKAVESDLGVIASSKEAATKTATLRALCQKDAKVSEQELMDAALEEKKALDAIGKAKKVAYRSDALKGLLQQKDKILTKLQKYVKRLHQALICVLGDVDIVILPTLDASANSSSECPFVFV
jgi:hypothetical protein